MDKKNNLQKVKNQDVVDLTSLFVYLTPCLLHGILVS